MDTVEALALISKQEESLRQTLGQCLRAVPRVAARNEVLQGRLADECLLPASCFYDHHIEICQDAVPPHRLPAHVPKNSGATSLQSGPRRRGGQREVDGPLMAYDLGRVLDAIIPSGKGGAWYDDTGQSLWVDVVNATANCVGRALDGARKAHDGERIKIHRRRVSLRTAEAWCSIARDFNAT